MVDNIVSAITGIFSAIGDFLTPTATENGLTTGMVAGIATLFAVPITIGVVRRVSGLVRKMRG